MHGLVQNPTHYSSVSCMCLIYGMPLFCVTLCACGLNQVAVTEGKARFMHKREWIIPPKVLKENKDYTQEDYISKVRHISLSL